MELSFFQKFPLFLLIHPCTSVVRFLFLYSSFEQQASFHSLCHCGWPHITKMPNIGASAEKNLKCGHSFCLLSSSFSRLGSSPLKKLHGPLPSPLLHLWIQRHNSFLVVKFSNTRNNSQQKSLEQTVWATAVDQGELCTQTHLYLAAVLTQAQLWGSDEPCKPPFTRFQPHRQRGWNVCQYYGFGVSYGEQTPCQYKKAHREQRSGPFNFSCPRKITSSKFMTMFWQI